MMLSGRGKNKQTATRAMPDFSPGWARRLGRPNLGESRRGGPKAIARPYDLTVSWSKKGSSGPGSRLESY
jgi:hypothetical protein